MINVYFVVLGAIVFIKSFYYQRKLKKRLPGCLMEQLYFISKYTG